MAGNSNSGRRNNEKPFRDALRAEIASIDLVSGETNRQLRLIARSLLSNAAEGKMDAIREVADRLDGKPAQETSLTIEDKRDATDWTRDELVAFLDDAKAGGNGTAKANGSNGKSDRVH